MRVKATQDGYYGMRLQREGSIFNLRAIKGKVLDKDKRTLVPHVFTPDEQFSSRWMEKLDASDDSEEDGEPIVEAPKRKGKSKPVGYSALADSESEAHSPSTGDRKVI